MFANRLIHETSPYLLQHAHNPVDWYPWGEEAFDKAKEENKPILLSIGYSACHWCHVMEKESFESEAIAALMNEHFVNIKVDREERPDLDEIYMNAVQMLTGRGGWPMTVFLTPERKPFFGGTYFPPEDRHGMPGFPKILQAVAQAYRDRPQDVQKSVEQILAALNRLTEISESAEPFSPDAIQKAADQLSPAYDPDYGGFGRAPKFPNAGVFDLFLRCYRSSKERRYLEMVTHTLTKMAEGGIYDHLGGGFHRYSVDEKWLVPHFEKMLYDNAQLIRIYVDVFRITQDPIFRRVVEETLTYLLREMLHSEGGFYSTQDADSEGEEGRFFVWEYDEVIKILGEETGEIFSRIYDVSELGNFEGKNILHPILQPEQAAKFFGKEIKEIENLIAEAKAKLLQEREKRVKPFRDEKILTSWNGLMLSGLAEAYKTIGEERYRKAAEKTVEFIFAQMFREGYLLHTYRDGQAKLYGYLDDYAFLAGGLLDLYEATFDRSLLKRAVQLTETMINEFWDDVEGGFFYTGKSHEQLISRTKPAFDASVPSGNSIATQILLRIYHYTGEENYLRRAERTLRIYYNAMMQQPFGFAHMFGALDFYLQKPKEIVVVGEKEKLATWELIKKLHSLYVPNKTLKLVEPGEPLGKVSPILEGKTQLNGKPTVYVCQNFTCSLPMTHWEELRGSLDG
ncbi:MAG: thioredoxin domain-containing protein [Deltaproteobacteria bacterium]|nr:MAG: thioredoxin domain-containing protein [Deltaproteobacteria bacterium]